VEVSRTVSAAVRRLIEAGADAIPITLPLLAEARAAVVVVLFSEATAMHHERLLEHPDWFGADVRDRLLRGQTFSAVDYLRALELRRAFRHVVELAFERVDVLVSPMLPVAAPPVGASTVPINDGTIDVLQATTANTREWNLLGIPAMSVPCGLTAGGLPIALQVVAPAFAESTMLRVARTHERRMPVAVALPRA
jgi:aspartyl-tRNA(Asn)/glutamyl-tRNA(Gln) amidotransferase subunit A